LAWHDKAECRGDPDPNAWYAHKLDTEGRAHALEVCGRCPVSWECLSFALDRDDRHGIWGGVLPEERGTAEDTRQAVLEALDVLGGRATISDLVGVTGLPHREVVKRLGSMTETRSGPASLVRSGRMTYALADAQVVSQGPSSVGGVA
jgi:WhiB family redox-sensing transcriptional regulator